MDMVNNRFINTSASTEAWRMLLKLCYFFFASHTLHLFFILSTNTTPNIELIV